MSKKLLHKTQRVYLYFSILLLGIVAPTFYLIANKFYLEEVDETLLLYKSEFIRNSISTLKEEEIPAWNRFNTFIEIQQYKGITNDTLFNATHLNYLENEYEPYRELNAPIRIDGHPYTLSIRTSLLESEDLILALVSLFITLFVLLFVGILLINKWLSRFLWKPFYQTLQQIEHFEIDKNIQPNFDKTDIEEFSRLNKSIHNLMEKNIAIYNNQREFVENAAHELQTPIAVFKAKIDTLIQRKDISQGQSEILISLNEAISRLQRLNKNLLLLSKMDSQQFNQTETLSIKEVIETQLGFFTEQALQKNIRIETSFENDIVISSKKGWTEIMVSNLLLNAIRHNVNDGEIQISGVGKNLIITNTGKPQKLPQEKLFSRFSKDNASTSGNGLGLAIVKKIVQINGWKIAYLYSENRHTFTVQFP